ncbi:pyridoxamine 5'-phosphate oxidase family protein [Nocardia fusca]|uniref:Pyridoxamine 5'-phosphate oxidase family protein n=1 Tax=Nocardia fusca TaxID=941183 RepID=A0ABV3FFE8_9NOCA
MATWEEFAGHAPRIAETFVRRHAATGNLCMLATLRSDGFPRISPMEPRFFEGRLWLIGMPGTTKFADLHRDPRFCLHTATVDTRAAEGDAKLFGTVRHDPDQRLHRRFTEALYARTGFDIRDRQFEHFYEADITGASSVELHDGRLDIRIWKPGRPERIVSKP